MKLALFRCLIMICAAVGMAAAAEMPLQWSELPPLPGTPGLGGAFAGAHGDALIVAGGANFGGKPPWEGGVKTYRSSVYLLEKGSKQWRAGGSLSHPMAYGGSVSTEEGFVLIGGRSGESILSDVLLLKWNAATRTVVQEALPSLPEPSAHHTAAAIGKTIYVAAGLRTAEWTSARKAFWALDLSKPERERKWRTLDPWPGPPRVKALSAVQSGGRKSRLFYLFSGERTVIGDDGQPRRVYLNDAYRYDPTTGAWRGLANLPRPVAAGTAAALGQSHILVFGGSAGKHIHKPVEERPEFPRDILAYHTITDTWTPAGEMPRGVVTTPAVWWGGKIVLPSGELEPGVRTSKVQAAELSRRGVSFGWVNYTVLGVYLAALVAMGVYFSRREKSTDEFFFAGRRIPWWAAGMSIYATQLSAITFIATPAVGYARDWIVYPAKITLLLMAPVVIFFYLPFFRRLNITTAYEYLERRFNLAVRLFGSVSFIVFQLGRMAIVLYLPALALSTITGLNIYACILLMGILATVYTVLGGMEAVIWTDVLQVIVLWGGMLVSVIIVLVIEGGPGAVYRAALTDGKLTMWNWSWDATTLTTWYCFLGTFALQFGPYTTDQAVIQRYLTTKDEKAAARSIWLNGCMSIPFGLLFFALGTCLYVYFKNRPELLSLGMHNDEIFPLFVARQLPAGVSGLVIAGAFAAAMSTLDSSMHSIATSITTDFYQRFRPDVSDRKRLNAARWLVVIIGALATLVGVMLARLDIKSLFFFFQKLLGFVSSGLVGVFILGIFTTRARPFGVLVGAAACFAILIYVVWFTALHFYLYALIGICTAVTVGYFASLLHPGGASDLTGLTLHTQARDR